MVSAKEQALEELTEYELWLDPDGCHKVERLIYILTLSICLGVYLAEPVLRCCRLYAQRTAQSRTLFRLTTTLPCAIYGPASAALLIMCWGDDTQEGALYVLLLTVQTLMIVEIWSTEPTPESAAYIFGCLPLFYLLAVLSVVLHDPDESEPQRAPPKPRLAEEHEMAELGSTRTLRGGPRIVDAGEPADGHCAPGGGGGRRTVPLRQRLRAIRAAARGAPKGPKGTRAGQPLGDAAYFGAGQTSRRCGEGGTRRVMIDSELDRELMT